MTRLTLPELTDTTSDEDHFNIYLEVLSEDILPRDADGDATDLAGGLGTSTYPFLAAGIKTGFLMAGSIIPWYDYNGALSIPQGYMLCNGAQITQANYDSQHSSGDWITYIGSSPIENLYAPDSNNKFFKGTTSTTQDGTIALTRTGNPSNTLDLSHDHGGGFASAATANQEKDAFGGGNTYNSASGGSHSHGFSISSALSTIDVTPPSIQVKFLIRVVE